MAQRFPILIILFSLVLAAGSSKAQPGPLHNFFAFVLYDKGKIVNDTNSFRYSWPNQCDDYIFKHMCANHIKDKKYNATMLGIGRIGFDTLYIVRMPYDTMQLTIIIQERTKTCYFTDRLNFRPGRYLLTDSSYHKDYIHNHSLRVQPVVRDSLGNFIVEEVKVQDSLTYYKRILLNKQGWKLKSGDWELRNERSN